MKRVLMAFVVLVSTFISLGLQAREMSLAIGQLESSSEFEKATFSQFTIDFTNTSVLERGQVAAAKNVSYLSDLENVVSATIKNRTGENISVEARCNYDRVGHLTVANEKRYKWTINKYSTRSHKISGNCSNILFTATYVLSKGIVFSEMNIEYWRQNHAVLTLLPTDNNGFIQENDSLQKNSSHGKQLTFVNLTDSKVSVSPKCNDDEIAKTTLFKILEKDFFSTHSVAPYETFSVPMDLCSDISHTIDPRTKNMVDRGFVEELGVYFHHNSSFHDLYMFWHPTNVD